MSKPVLGYEGVIITPWANPQELMTVHDLLYSFGSPELQGKGLKQVAIWRDRAGSLPVSVEMTAAVVSTHLRFNTIAKVHWRRLRQVQHCMSLISDEPIAHYVGQDDNCGSVAATSKGGERRSIEPNQCSNGGSEDDWRETCEEDDGEIGESEIITIDRMGETSCETGTGKEEEQKLQYHEEMAARYEMSAIIIRFVNGVIDPEQRSERVTSISRIAMSIDLDRNLVDMRHSATHNELPTFAALCTSFVTLLEWLETYFWSVQLKGVLKRFKVAAESLREYNEIMETILQEQSSELYDLDKRDTRIQDINKAIVKVHAVITDLIANEGGYFLTSQYTNLLSETSVALLLVTGSTLEDDKVSRKHLSSGRQSIMLWIIQQFIFPELLSENGFFKPPSNIKIHEYVAHHGVEKCVDSILLKWYPLLKHIRATLVNPSLFETSLVLALVHFIVLIQLQMNDSSTLWSITDIITTFPFLFRASTLLGGEHIDKNATLNASQALNFRKRELNALSMLTFEFLKRLLNWGQYDLQIDANPQFLSNNKVVLTWIQQRRSEEIISQQINAGTSRSNNTKSDNGKQQKGQFTDQLAELVRTRSLFSSLLPPLVDWVAIDRLLCSFSSQSDNQSECQSHNNMIILRKLIAVAAEKEWQKEYALEHALNVSGSDNSELLPISNLKVRQRLYNDQSEAPDHFQNVYEELTKEESTKRVKTREGAPVENLREGKKVCNYVGTSLFGFLDSMETMWKPSSLHSSARPTGIYSFGLLVQSDFI